MWRRSGSRRWRNPALPLAEPSPAFAQSERWEVSALVGSWRSVGVRAHVRYKPIVLNDEDALPFCDPFGFCQNWLQQFEYVAGVLVRFE